MRVLRNRGFALVWLAGLLSQVGDWVLRVALPFHVYQQTGSVLATGAMFAAETLPPLLLGSAAGVLVDRWDRRRTMIAADLVRGGLLLPLVLAPPDVQFWLLYPVAFLSSTVSLLFGPARAALVPRLVGEENLTRANAVSAQTAPLARLVAPPLGGALVAAFGLEAALLIDGASFFLSAALIAGVAAAAGAPPPRTEVAGRRLRGRAELWAEWWDGLAVVATSRTLVVLFATGAAANLTEGMSAPLFVPFIEQVLHGGPAEIGLWFAANGAGVLVGAALVAAWGERVSPARLLGIGYAAVGVFCLARNVAPALLPPLVPGLSPAAAGILLTPLVGAVAAGVFAAHPTLLQRAAPDAYRGRVFGALGTTDAAAMLCGAALATALGDRLGPLPFYHVLGAAYVLSGIAVLVGLPGATRAAPDRGGGTA
jgi:MFS family permease